MPAGRPTDLTTEPCAAICEDIKTGLPGETAAECQGVARSTFYSWLARGREEQTGLYAEFLDATTRARAEAAKEAFLTFKASWQLVDGKALVDGKMALEWLRRREQKLWEPPKQIEQTVTQDSPLANGDAQSRIAYLKSMLAALESGQKDGDK